MDEVVREARNLRRSFELWASGAEASFPVGYCKWASLVLVYHLLKKWPDITIQGVQGIANDRLVSDLSHYWLEVDGVVIDITADQYNFLKEKCLSDEVASLKPYPGVCYGVIGCTFHADVFSVTGRDIFLYGLEDLAEDFIWQLEDFYSEISVFL